LGVVQLITQHWVLNNSLFLNDHFLAIIDLASGVLWHLEASMMLFFLLKPELGSISCVEWVDIAWGVVGIWGARWVGLPSLDVRVIDKN
jgi:hypothetical protein